MGKLAELKAEMATIVDAAKAHSLTADQSTRFDALKGEIEAEQKRLKTIADSEELFKGLDGAQAKEPDEAPAKSLGDHFVKSLKGRSLKSPGTIVAPEFKAATDTQTVGTHDGAFGPLVTDIDRSFVMPVRRRLVIADLLGSGSVSGNAITYPVWGALEGGTGFVSEGGQKPQLHVADPTWRTDALAEIAGWFKMTDDMAEDIPYVVSEINSTALYDLALKEEAALLNGDGTSPNLLGLLNRGIQEYESEGEDADVDALFHAITLVEQNSPRSANGLVINPADYEKFRLNKDGNGQYYGGGYFQGQYGQGGLLEKPNLWGLRTVVTPAVAAGTVLVGDFSSATVFRKGGVRVESTNSHEDDFTNDKITVRVRERLGLQVKYPAAFVNVTLAGAGE